MQSQMGKGLVLILPYVTHLPLWAAQRQKIKVNVFAASVSLFLLMVI